MLSKKDIIARQRAGLRYRGLRSISKFYEAEKNKPIPKSPEPEKSEIKETVQSAETHESELKSKTPPSSPKSIPTYFKDYDLY